MSKVVDVVLTTLIPRSPIFTTRDAADATGVGLSVASRDLGQLARRSVLTRITQGIWADVRHPDFSPYAVVPVLLRSTPSAGTRHPDELGYVSLLSALNLRGMIQQIPHVIQVVSASQRPPLRTPVGTYEFHRLEASLLGGAEPFGPRGAFTVATAAKALFDTLYFSVRRGRRFAALPELEWPRDFSVRELEQWIRRISYPSLRTAVQTRWQSIRSNALVR